MTIFDDISSGLRFSLDEKWTDLAQYDEHPDVRKYANGLSCIDFIGVFSEKKLVLMEAKNFKNRPVEEHQTILQRLGTRNKSPLIDEVAENMKDSVLFCTLVSSKLQLSDSAYWKSLREKLLDNDIEIICVLWMEFSFKFENEKGKSVAVFAQTAIMENMMKAKLKWLTSERNIIISRETENQNPFYPHLKVSFQKK